MNRIVALTNCFNRCMPGSTAPPPCGRGSVQRPRRNLTVLVVACLIASLSRVQAAQEGGGGSVLNEAWVQSLSWRCIGPANMGGRITAIAVYEADPSIWYVATASGGLLKTTNNGVTFEHQFDHENTVSIGDVAVFQGNADVVWVGTGEANPRNSVSWGDGVYRSTDGGKTWTHCGLKGSFQIGQIALHPTNPDVAYVGALGRLWGPNEERGLFKTVDGGKTWEKVLYLDERTGVIDVQLKPGDPDTLLAATYERKRDAFDGNDPAVKIAPGSGLYRSTDGGRNWVKVVRGLPTGLLGRIGVEFYRKDPNVVYLVLESERIGKEPANAAYFGVRGEDANVGARLTEVTKDGPADKAGLLVGDVVVAVDDETIHGYDDLNRAIRRRLAGEQVRIEVSRERKSVYLDATFGARPGASTAPAAEGAPRGPQSASATAPFSSGLGGQRENVHDQQGPDGHEFGGVYRSTDGGESWTRINSVNPRPMYFSEIRVDPSDSNYVYVLGISLYRSKDGGSTFTADGGNGAHPDHHALWIDPRDGRHQILGNDGGVYVTYDRQDHWDHLNNTAIGQFYHVAAGPNRDYMVYGGLQDNGSWGGPSRSRSGRGPINQDWINIGGGDGFVCLVDPTDADQVYFESQNGGMGRINLRTGERGFIRPPADRGVRYRWNWKTPMILSHHNTEILYAAGNYVFRSLKKGEGMKRISPEITRTNQGSATALAESKFDPDVLYVGTDDGALWVTSNGGHQWTPLTDFPKEQTPAGAADRSILEATVHNVAESASSAASAILKAAAQIAENPPAARQREPDSPPAPPAQPPSDPPRAEGTPPSEGGRAPGRGGFTAMLQRMDADGDGKITKDEVPERMQGMFERLDADRDGAISQEEMRQAGERARSEGGAPGRGGPPPREGSGDPPPGALPASHGPFSQETPTASPQAGRDTAAGAAALVGTWSGQLISDQMPPGAGAFTLTFKVDAAGVLSGVVASQMGESEMLDVKFDPSGGRLTFAAQREGASFDFEANVKGERMSGRFVAEGGVFEMDFEATRKGVQAPMGAGSAAQVSAAPAASSATVAPAASAEGNPAAGGAGSAGGATAGPTVSSLSTGGTNLNTLLPGARWVSSLETSRFKAGRVYVTFDGHRSDDDEPYVFMSEDEGKTWTSIRANLPTSAGSTRVIREDVVNEDILYLGTEFGAYISVDRGGSWTRLNTNLPTVAVHEFAIHPTAGEVVAATHGRSLWILDVTPIRQMTRKTFTADAHLFKPNNRIYWRPEPSRGDSGARRFVGENPNDQAEIFYLLREPAQRVSLEIQDLSGELIRTLEPKREAGLHRVTWDLRRTPPEASSGGGPPGGGRFRGGASLVPSGSYVIALKVDGKTLTERLEVQTDPEYPDYRPWERGGTGAEDEIAEPEDGDGTGIDDRGPEL